MFRCPCCGSSSRIRTSRSLTDENTVRRKYYQCNNIECGFCFSTLEAFEKQTSVNTPKINIPGAGLSSLVAKKLI
ncbi:ogr/Delta-like zinc finger family protein [Salmonella enterica]|uniref:Zinc finger Ogr/Delta-type domain-containing protein n=2 Tax=Salmonella enterica TaxID=28901 RepID=A0A737B621_SALNE|nr:hypothetical protein [Salmonella enterica]EDE3115167.1 hypothetical protein [Salmonella enterica subsp. enterica serovar Muenchen]EDI2255359.1 hypothetical protein [Salmonella enterica subsp. enterica serovar Typhimurium]EDR5008956.1 hypothetical protein [Salmonella enterica subsp. enterica serovar Gaminara]EEC2583826.1 hypothetical protein [Salmonella enterica subsp. enterica serovar Rubislaw]EFO5649008.1 hypothetical protein [Salmonella enterica subsp. enterica serovar Miami]EGY1028702.1